MTTYIDSDGDLAEDGGRFSSNKWFLAVCWVPQYELKQIWNSMPSQIGWPLRTLHVNSSGTHETNLPLNWMFP